MARYAIFYTRTANADLKSLGRRVEVLVVEAISRYLSDAPVPLPGEEGQRKLLDKNPLGAQYRLRVGEYRAYYNVDEEAAEVEIIRVGYKPRDAVFFRGKPTPMRD